jgi:hypothetical protein
MMLCRFLRTGAPWQDLPTHCRAYQSVAAFSSLAQSSLIGAVLQGLASDSHGGENSILQNVS